MGVRRAGRKILKVVEGDTDFCTLEDKGDGFSSGVFSECSMQVVMVQQSKQKRVKGVRTG